MMKQWMKKRRNRGFTLVELLIVIVIIGILAGSLLLVMGSGTDKANATKIVSDMRTLKAAQLMHYSDYDTWANDIEAANFTKYLDRTPASTLGVYTITGTSSDATVVFTFDSGGGDTGAGLRLDQMAVSTGIVKSGDVCTMVVAQ